MQIKVAIAIAVAFILLVTVVAGVVLLDGKVKPVGSGQGTQHSAEEIGGSK